MDNKKECKLKDMKGTREYKIKSKNLNELSDLIEEERMLYSKYRDTLIKLYNFKIEFEFI